MNCCNHTKKKRFCLRKFDKKRFSLPRKYSRKRCLGKIKGFTMRSSCAPYKYCKNKSRHTRRTMRTKNK